MSFPRKLALVGPEIACGDAAEVPAGRNRLHARSYNGVKRITSSQAVYSLVGAYAPPGVRSQPQSVAKERVSAASRIHYLVQSSAHHCCYSVRLDHMSIDRSNLGIYFGYLHTLLRPSVDPPGKTQVKHVTDNNKLDKLLKDDLDMLITEGRRTLDQQSGRFDRRCLSHCLSWSAHTSHGTGDAAYRQDCFQSH